MLVEHKLEGVPAGWGAIGEDDEIAKPQLAANKRWDIWSQTGREAGKDMQISHSL